MVTVRCYACNEDVDVFVANEDEVYYHPLFSDCRCCHYCFKKLTKVEELIQDMIQRSSRDNSEWIHGESCSSCAGAILDEDGQDYDLLLCDNCPRGICYACVANSVGWHAVQDILHRKGSTFECRYCIDQKYKPELGSNHEPLHNAEWDTDEEEWNGHDGEMGDEITSPITDEEITLAESLLGNFNSQGDVNDSRVDDEHTLRIRETFFDQHQFFMNRYDLEDITQFSRIQFRLENRMPAEYYDWRYSIDPLSRLRISALTDTMGLLTLNPAVGSLNEPRLDESTRSSSTLNLQSSAPPPLNQQPRPTSIQPRDGSANPSVNRPTLQQYGFVSSRERATTAASATNNDTLQGDPQAPVYSVVKSLTSKRCTVAIDGVMCNTPTNEVCTHHGNSKNNANRHPVCNVHRYYKHYRHAGKKAGGMCIVHQDAITKQRRKREQVLRDQKARNADEGKCNGFNRAKCPFKGMVPAPDIANQISLSYCLQCQLRSDADIVVHSNRIETHKGEWRNKPLPGESLKEQVERDLVKKDIVASIDDESKEMILEDDFLFYDSEYIRQLVIKNPIFLSEQVFVNKKLLLRILQTGSYFEHYMSTEKLPLRFTVQWNGGQVEEMTGADVVEIIRGLLARYTLCTYHAVDIHRLKELFAYHNVVYEDTWKHMDFFCRVGAKIITSLPNDNRLYLPNAKMFTIGYFMDGVNGEVNPEANYKLMETKEKCEYDARALMCFFFIIYTILLEAEKQKTGEKKG